MENNFIPIQAETLFTGSKISFDVYVRSVEKKMILYCTRDKAVSPEARQKLYSDQLSDRLFILEKDKTYYHSYIESVLTNILLESNLPVHEKSEIAYDAIKGCAESLFRSPNAKKIQQYKKVIFDTMDFVLKKNESLQHLISMTSLDTSLHNHCINVGIYSIGITLELLKKKPYLKYYEMVAGFFLHDIGKCGIPLEIFKKKGTLTNKEWKLIKKHPDEGCNILKINKALTKETEIIVSQHHERINGSGYPLGLTGDDIHLYAKICALADVFEALTSQRSYRKKCSSFAALKIMKDRVFRDFDPMLFSMFVNIFGK